MASSKKQVSQASSSKLPCKTNSHNYKGLQSSHDSDVDQQKKGLEARCRASIVSLYISEEENLAEIEGFKGVDWLKPEAPWPPDAERRVHRYMHYNDLYQVTNFNDPVFVDLVKLVKAEAGVPNTRNWEQKVPEKCLALIMLSTVAWERDGVLVRRLDGDRLMKSALFKELWDRAVREALASHLRTQTTGLSAERNWPLDDSKKGASATIRDPATGAAETSAKHCAVKRSAEAVPESWTVPSDKRIRRDSSQTSRSDDRCSAKGGLQNALDLDHLGQTTTGGRGTCLDTLSGGDGPSAGTISETSERTVEQTVQAARDALSSLDQGDQSSDLRSSLATTQDGGLTSRPFPPPGPSPQSNQNESPSEVSPNMEVQNGSRISHDRQESVTPLPASFEPVRGVNSSPLTTRTDNRPTPNIQTSETGSQYNTTPMEEPTQERHFLNRASHRENSFNTVDSSPESLFEDSFLLPGSSEFKSELSESPQTPQHSGLAPGVAQDEAMFQLSPLDAGRTDASSVSGIGSTQPTPAHHHNLTPTQETYTSSRLSSGGNWKSQGTFTQSTVGCQFPESFRASSSSQRHSDQIPKQYPNIHQDGPAPNLPPSQSITLPPILSADSAPPPPRPTQHQASPITQPNPPLPPLSTQCQTTSLVAPPPQSQNSNPKATKLLPKPHYPPRPSSPTQYRPPPSLSSQAGRSEPRPALPPQFQPSTLSQNQQPESTPLSKSQSQQAPSNLSQPQSQTGNGHPPSSQYQCATQSLGPPRVQHLAHQTSDIPFSTQVQYPVPPPPPQYQNHPTHLNPPPPPNLPPPPPPQESPNTAFSASNPPGGDQAPSLAVRQKLIETIRIIVPLHARGSEIFSYNNPPSSYRIFCGHAICLDVAGFFQWVSEIVEIGNNAVLRFDFMHVQDQLRQRIWVSQGDFKTFREVRQTALSICQEIWHQAQRAAIAVVVVTAHRPILGGANGIHAQPLHLDRSNTNPGSSEDRPNIAPPSRDGYRVALDTGGYVADVDTNRGQTTNVFNPAEGVSPPIAQHSKVNSGPIGTNTEESTSNIGKPGSASSTSSAMAIQGSQLQQADQQLQLQGKSSQPNSSNKISGAKVIVRLQADACGRLTRGFDKFVLNPKVTNEKFFTWFAQETGREAPQKLRFDFKDALPPRCSVIERGNEDHFHYMVNDIKRKFTHARDYTPEMKEFAIVVTDPTWDVGNGEEEEEEEW